MYELHQRKFVVPGSQELACICGNLVQTYIRKDVMERGKKTVSNRNILNCAICRCATLPNTVLITVTVTIFKSEVLHTEYNTH